MATIEERVARLELLLSNLDDAGDVPIPVAERSLEIHTFSNLNQLGLSGATATEEAIVEAMPDGSRLYVDCTVGSMPMLSLWDVTGDDRYGMLDILRVNANRVYLTWRSTNTVVDAIVEWAAQYRAVNTPTMSDWYRTWPIGGLSIKTYVDLEELGLPDDATRQQVFDALPVGSTITSWAGSSATVGELRPPTGRSGAFTLYKVSASEGNGMLIGQGAGYSPEVFRFMVTLSTVRDWFQTYPEV